MVSALEDCQEQSSKELALCRDGNRLREFEREVRLGGELYVPFVGPDSRGSAGTGAATNHQPVALLVALAGAVKGGGMWMG